MMGTVKIDTTKLRKLIQLDFAAELELTARDIEKDAKENAPVNSGTLRDSIEARLVDKDTAEVVVGAEYAAVVEFGGADRPAKPFLVPAVEKNLDELVRRIADKINGI